MGLVYQQRDGTTLYCHADYETMDATLTFLTRECCVDGRRAADACPGETAADACPGETNAGANNTHSAA